MFLGLVAGACLAPTLPLPPPSKPDVEGPDDQGNVTLRGSVQPDAWVIAQNATNGDGDSQRASSDGSYVLVFAAASGDEIALYYRIGTEESSSLLFQIP